jgi:hypothetical protein
LALSLMFGEVFGRLRPDLLKAFEQGMSMGAGVRLRAGRSRNHFPCRSGVGVSLPLRLTGKQVQKIKRTWACGNLILKLP